MWKEAVFAYFRQTYCYRVCVEGSYENQGNLRYTKRGGQSTQDCEVLCQ
jgi:hypothetical protein